MLKVRNIEGSSGREVPNQFIIKGNGNVYFQSYQSVCAKYNRKAKKLTVGCDCLYSTTTAKYLYKFVKEETPINGVDRKVILKAMNEGSIDFDGYTIEFNKNMVW